MEVKTAGVLSGRGRREAILGLLRTQVGPIKGAELARHFQVSRQSIIQDVLILRASGHEILSTPQGYLLPKTGGPRRHRAVLACRHRPEETEEELQILVDLGVKVLDVIVEHPLYGELKGHLMLESRADVQAFLHQVEVTGAKLLSSLTDGVHLHTVEASRPELLAEAQTRLRARGFLLEPEA